eukprot:GHVR01124568.1.p1 GENE.GHVR01124568.1~~GHVR01124568.1.p1  ORF type:complete len:571 (+),score=145.46 GHVR01124568.1:78-1790(+)
MNNILLKTRQLCTFTNSYISLTNRYINSTNKHITSKDHHMPSTDGHSSSTCDDIRATDQYRHIGSQYQHTDSKDGHIPSYQHIPSSSYQHINTYANMNTPNRYINTNEHLSIRDEHISSKSRYSYLPRSCNQALGIGEYAIGILNGKYGDSIDEEVYKKAALLHTDSVMCGVSAVALKAKVPIILREEAIQYPDACGARVFGSKLRCRTEKAVVANSAAVREWNFNAVRMGYRPNMPDHQVKSVDNSDFYPVVMAAAQSSGGVDGRTALTGMILIDEIRARLSETVPLHTQYVHNDMNGAVATAAVYGAILGATAEQIQSAIGLTVSHYVPYCALESSVMPTESQAAAAAFSAEVAVLSVKRAMSGISGPKDIFRKADTVFNFHRDHQEDYESSFDLVLTNSGRDFAIMDTQFKLSICDYQCEAALQCVYNILLSHPEIVDDKEEGIQKIQVKTSESVYRLLFDERHRETHEREWAVKSFYYTLAATLRKAFMLHDVPKTLNQLKKELMLSPLDLYRSDLNDRTTHSLIGKINLCYGGKLFDSLTYFNPTSVEIHTHTHTHTHIKESLWA